VYDLGEMRIFMVTKSYWYAAKL